MSSDAKYTQQQIVKHLVGGTILAAGIDDSSPTAWEQFACLVVDVNGKKLHVWVQSDAEGNSPGHLNIETPAGELVT